MTFPTHTSSLLRCKSCGVVFSHFSEYIQCLWLELPVWSTWDYLRIIKKRSQQQFDSKFVAKGNKVYLYRTVLQILFILQEFFPLHTRLANEMFIIIKELIRLQSIYEIFQIFIICKIVHCEPLRKWLNCSLNFWFNSLWPFVLKAIFIWMVWMSKKYIHCISIEWVIILWHSHVRIVFTNFSTKTGAIISYRKNVVSFLLIFSLKNSQFFMTKMKY